MVDGVRSLFKRIYKIGMILITTVLAALTVISYMSATPGNGLLLITGILAIGTLIAGLSISKLDDQERQGEIYRQIGQEFRGLVQGSTTFGYASPDVHRIDAATVEEAKRMASDGASIDDICSAIDPEHVAHDPAHRQAFRNVVQAMIDQG